MSEPPRNVVLGLMLFMCSLILTVEGCVAGEPAPVTGPRPPIGLNLTGVTYYSTEIPFVDVMKMSSEWISQMEGKPFGEGGPLTLTDQGDVRALRPSQFAEKLIFADLEGHYPGGTYTCFYDGRGTLTFGLAAQVRSRGDGVFRVDVDPKKGPISVQIRATEMNDPIRNIRLVLPGFEKTHAREPFHPDFLQRVKKFDVLRFMDWGNTNNSTLETWTDRVTHTASTQGGPKGVAYDYMIALANRAEADPWLCVPHRADDAYVRAFAELTKKYLDSERRIYLEYSNEVWNGMFEQAAYAREQGVAENLGSNDFESQLRFYSQRAVEVFKIWEEVFGESDRLVRVLGAQSVNVWTGTTIMDWQNAYKQADAVAIGPYFGNRFGDPQTRDTVARMSVEEILDGCREDIEQNQKFTQEFVTAAEKRGLKVFAYEGGQHLVGYGGAENDERLEKLFHAANRHPRMKELYLKDLRAWQTSRGGAYMIFSSMGRYSKWGSWGLLEFSDQDPSTAPKYQAVREYLRER